MGLIVILVLAFGVMFVAFKGTSAIGSLSSKINDSDGMVVNTLFNSGDKARVTKALKKTMREFVESDDIYFETRGGRVKVKYSKKALMKITPYRKKHKIPSDKINDYAMQLLRVNGSPIDINQDNYDSRSKNNGRDNNGFDDFNDRNMNGNRNRNNGRVRPSRNDNYNNGNNYNNSYDDFYNRDDAEFDSYRETTGHRMTNNQFANGYNTDINDSPYDYYNPRDNMRYENNANYVNPNYMGMGRDTEHMTEFIEDDFTMAQSSEPLDTINMSELDTFSGIYPGDDELGHFVGDVIGDEFFNEGISSGEITDKKMGPIGGMDLGI